MGRTAGIKLSGKEINELENARKQTKDAQSFRAMTGVWLRCQGQSAETVGKNLGVCTKQVFMWCKRYKKKGIGGLALSKPPGRSPKEGNKAKERLPALLRCDPQLFGYLKGRWVVRDISKQLKKEGINLSFQSVDRVLHELGIPLKRPKLRAHGSIHKNYRKRKEIANFKNVAGALIKKGSP
jgi:transposase